MKKIILTILSLALVASFSFAEKVEASGWEFSGYLPESMLLQGYVDSTFRLSSLHLLNLNTRATVVGEDITKNIKDVLPLNRLSSVDNERNYDTSRLTGSKRSDINLTNKFNFEKNNNVLISRRSENRNINYANNIIEKQGFEPNQLQSFQGTFNKYVTISGNQVPLTVRGEGAITVALSYYGGGFDIYGGSRKILTNDWQTHYWPIPAGKKVKKIGINLDNNEMTNHAYVEVQEYPGKLKPLLTQ
ncbi:MAG: hypothetical protein K9L98_01460 [Candidatus Pacebacteria bacterium]|nr:hypothetical protein [Candidatus Paceibacterota bacterium]MCF7862660.1 hypothetical protein [Candidatus Paceibacterota bacterium]